MTFLELNMNLSSQLESINLIISDVVLSERLFIINNVFFLKIYVA